jgi:hypothetical protein
MSRLTNFLRGYRTYIAAAGLALLAVANAVSGEPEAQAKAIQFIMEALGLFGVRSAIAKVAEEVLKAK